MNGHGRFLRSLAFAGGAKITVAPSGILREIDLFGLCWALSSAIGIGGAFRLFRGALSLVSIFLY